MCSCSLSFFFFIGTHFQLGGRKHFSFSHRRYEIFMFFFKRNWSPLFLYLALALSLLSTSMQTLKFSRKKDSALLLFSFLSESLGGHAIYRRNAQVLVTRNFTTAYMNGWTYVCAHGRFFQNQNFFGCINNQIFLPMVLPCARIARAMSPLLQAITT